MNITSLITVRDTYICPKVIINNKILVISAYINLKFVIITLCTQMCQGCRHHLLFIAKLIKCDGSLFFTNLMHQFFILIHLLHSCTCFEHSCAHLQEDNFISVASGIVTLFR